MCIVGSDVFVVGGWGRASPYYCKVHASIDIKKKKKTGGCMRGWGKRNIACAIE